SMRMPSTRVSVEGIRIDGLVSSGSSEGTIVLKNAALHQSDGGLELNNVAVETPFATGTAKPREGKISVGAFAVNGVTLPVPTGAAYIANGKLQATATWEPLKDAK